MYKNLRKIRKQKNISAAEMAKMLGLQKAAYYKKESGRIRFSLNEAKLIADRLGLPIEEVFFDNEVSIMETGKQATAADQTA